MRIRVGLLATVLGCIGSLGASAQTSSFPEGIYVSREAQDPRGVSRYSGVEFHFTGGRYEMRRDGEPRVAGTYLAEGGRLTITDVDGAWACRPPQPTSATYSWRLDGGQLVLAATGDDACNRRRNRLDGAALIRGKVPPLPDVIASPDELRESWESFWLHSDAPGWVENLFARDARAEDGNRKLIGIEQIKQWLDGQDSRKPQAFPFQFDKTPSRIVEKGRYRDVFGSPDGSTRILVGRYQITWVPASGSKWKVQEWILR